MKNKVFSMLAGTVLSALVLGACGNAANNKDRIAPQRINNPVNDRNDLNGDGINDNINNRDLNRNGINDRNDLDLNNRNDINDRNNLNDNYYPPSKDKNTDTDKDMIKDNNTKQEDLIEDDIDTKDRDRKDE